MNISPEDFQRYLRIVLQWVAGALVSYGIVNKDATWLAPAIGFALTAGSFLWSLYGNRVQAKINEVAALKKPDGEKLVEGMKVTSVIVANAAPANVTAATTATQ